jgi:hypothetical protein
MVKIDPHTTTPKPIVYRNIRGEYGDITLVLHSDGNITMHFHYDPGVAQHMRLADATEIAVELIRLAADYRMNPSSG